jgi:hypothetical protein
MRNVTSRVMRDVIMCDEGSPCSGATWHSLHHPAAVKVFSASTSKHHTGMHRHPSIDDLFAHADAMFAACFLFTDAGPQDVGGAGGLHEGAVRAL